MSKKYILGRSVCATEISRPKLAHRDPPSSNSLFSIFRPDGYVVTTLNITCFLLQQTIKILGTGVPGRKETCTSWLPRFAFSFICSFSFAPTGCQKFISARNVWATCCLPNLQHRLFSFLNRGWTSILGTWMNVWKRCAIATICVHLSHRSVVLTFYFALRTSNVEHQLTPKYRVFHSPLIFDSKSLRLWFV